MVHVHEYACISGVGAPAGEKTGAVARCRKLVPCDIHERPENWAPAPRPDVVLVKVNIPRREELTWRNSGIHLVDRSPDRAEALAAMHAAQAEALGRNALVVRARRGEQLDLPESKDSGTPVFGVEGLRGGTTAAALIKDLADAGFKLTNAHLLMRDWKPPIRLVLEFSRAGERVQGFAWFMLRRLPTTFGRIDVWANPIDRRGLCVHTVNCGERQPDKQPIYALRFANGDWAAEETQPSTV